MKARWVNTSYFLAHILAFIYLFQEALSWDQDIPGGIKVRIGGQFYGATTDLCSGGIFFKRPVAIEKICSHGYFFRRPNGCSMTNSDIISGKNYVCSNDSGLVQAIIPITPPELPTDHSIAFYDDPDTLRNFRRYAFAKGLRHQYAGSDEGAVGVVVANSHNTPRIGIGHMCYEGKPATGGAAFQTDLPSYYSYRGSNEFFSRKCREDSYFFQWRKARRYPYTEGFSDPEDFEGEIEAELGDNGVQPTEEPSITFPEGELGGAGGQNDTGEPGQGAGGPSPNDIYPGKLPLVDFPETAVKAPSSGYSGKLPLVDFPEVTVKSPGSDYTGNLPLVDFPEVKEKVPGSGYAGNLPLVDFHEVKEKVPGSGYAGNLPLVDFPEVTAKAPGSAYIGNLPLVDFPDAKAKAPGSSYAGNLPLVDFPEATSIAPGTGSSGYNNTFPIIDFPAEVTEQPSSGYIGNGPIIDFPDTSTKQPGSGYTGNKPLLDFAETISEKPTSGYSGDKPLLDFPIAQQPGETPLIDFPPTESSSGGYTGKPLLDFPNEIIPDGPPGDEGSAGKTLIDFPGNGNEEGVGQGPVVKPSPGVPAADRTTVDPLLDFAEEYSSSESGEDDEVISTTQPQSTTPRDHEIIDPPIKPSGGPSKPDTHPPKQESIIDSAESDETTEPSIGNSASGEEGSEEEVEQTEKPTESEPTQSKPVKPEPSKSKPSSNQSSQDKPSKNQSSKAEPSNQPPAPSGESEEGQKGGQNGEPEGSESGSEEKVDQTPKTQAPSTNRPKPTSGTKPQPPSATKKPSSSGSKTQAPAVSKPGKPSGESEEGQDGVEEAEAEGSESGSEEKADQPPKIQAPSVNKPQASSVNNPQVPSINKPQKPSGSKTPAPPVSKPKPEQEGHNSTSEVAGYSEEASGESEEATTAGFPHYEVVPGPLEHKKDKIDEKPETAGADTPQIQIDFPSKETPTSTGQEEGGESYVGTKTLIDFPITESPTLPSESGESPSSPGEVEEQYAGSKPLVDFPTTGESNGGYEGSKPLVDFPERGESEGEGEGASEGGYTGTKPLVDFPQTGDSEGVVEGEGQYTGSKPLVDFQLTAGGEGGYSGSKPLMDFPQTGEGDGPGKSEGQYTGSKPLIDFQLPVDGEGGYAGTKPLMDFPQTGDSDAVGGNKGQYTGSKPLIDFPTQTGGSGGEVPFRPTKRPHLGIVLDLPDRPADDSGNVIDKPSSEEETPESKMNEIFRHSPIRLKPIPIINEGLTNWDPYVEESIYIAKSKFLQELGFTGNFDYQTGKVGGSMSPSAISEKPKQTWFQILQASGAVVKATAAEDLLNPEFIDDVVSLFGYIFRAVPDESKLIDDSNLQTILGSIQKCERAVKKINASLTGCPAKFHHVEITNEDGTNNAFDLIKSPPMESSFRTHHNDVIVESVWNIVDIVLCSCYDAFAADSADAYHVLYAYMKQFFLNERVQRRWYSAFKGVDAYSGILPQGYFKTIMYNYDKLKAALHLNCQDQAWIPKPEFVVPNYAYKNIFRTSKKYSNAGKAGKISNSVKNGDNDDPFLIGNPTVTFSKPFKSRAYGRKGVVWRVKRQAELPLMDFTVERPLKRGRRDVNAPDNSILDSTKIEIWGGMAYCLQANYIEGSDGKFDMRGISPSIESLKPLCAAEGGPTEKY